MDYRPNPKVWHGTNHCKTRSARNFALTHMAVVAVLERWKDEELIINLRDEGHWYPGHDISALAYTTGQNPGAIAQYASIFHQPPLRLIKDQTPLPRP